LKGATSAFVEAIVAFVLILVVSTLIYMLGRRAAPKPVQSEGERSAYACGEKASFRGLRVNVSLYKYLIYFVILDSSVLLLAFASFIGSGINSTLLILYLFMMLASAVLLFEGGKA
jgi:NADH:ubiquinone oxidoreductase subunit 3 (subunit A)